MKYFVLPIFVFTILTGCSDEDPIPFYVVTNGHAHNDYEQKRPLYEALEAGFVSIEADVHLINDSLFVVHDAPQSTSGIPTLTELYLKPLAHWIDENEGKVYAQYDEFLYLMIDLKTDGASTYPVLKKELAKFEDYISVVSDSTDQLKKPVKVFISGNRPIEMILADTLKYAAIDGRPENIDQGFSTAIMPVISKNYSAFLSWKGEGEIDDEELRGVKLMIDSAHKEGKKVRLWGAPDTPEVWEFLLSTGVDWINTDRLQEFRTYSKDSHFIRL